MESSPTTVPRRTHAAHARIFRLLNPVMRFMLRRPLRPLREKLLLLSFSGRKSGKSFTVPLSYYEEQDGNLLVPGGGAWKWNLAGGRPVQVMLRGEDRQAKPEMIREPSEVARLLPAMMAANPRVGSFVGVPLGPDGKPDRQMLDHVMHDGFMLIRLRLA
jgi:hypothetical protein